MTKDRTNLLLSVWEQMYSRRCRCGRCDCISSDPVELARIIFVHWSIQLRGIASSAERGAKWRRELAEEWVQKAKRKRPRALTRAELVAQATASGARLLAEAEREDFTARRCARAAVRYERLGRGLPPFAATLPIGTAEGSKR